MYRDDPAASPATPRVEQPRWFSGSLRWIWHGCWDMCRHDGLVLIGTPWSRLLCRIFGHRVQFVAELVGRGLHYDLSRIATLRCSRCHKFYGQASRAGDFTNGVEIGSGGSVMWTPLVFGENCGVEGRGVTVPDFTAELALRVAPEPVDGDVAGPAVAVDGEDGVDAVALRALDLR